MNNKILFALGPILSAVLTFITLPVMTWFFSVEDIARFSMLQVLIPLSVVFMSIGLDQAYVREYHSHQSGMTEKNKLLQHIFPGITLGLIIVSIWVFWNKYVIEKLFDSDASTLKLTIVFVVFAYWVLNFFTIYFRLSNNPKSFIQSLVLPKVLFLTGVFSLYWFHMKGFDNIVLMLMISTLISVLLLMGGCVVNLTKMSWSLDFSYIKKTIKYSLPIMFSALFLWLTLAVDRLSLKFLSSFDELAIYAVSFTFAGVAMLVQSIFSTLWFPEVYKEYEKTGDYKNIDKALNLIIIATVLVFFLIGIFSPLVTYILPSEYQSVQYLIMASIAYPLFLVVSEVSGVGIGLKKRTILNFISIFIAFILNVAFNFLLVPKMGAKGAVIASAISFFIYLVIKTELSNRVWKQVATVKVYVSQLWILILSGVYILSETEYLAVIVSGLGLSILLVFYKKEIRLSMESMIKSIRVTK